MKTTSNTAYKLSLLGESGWFAEDNYSKHKERVQMYKDGEISKDEIFGYEQCLELMEEIKGRELFGKKVHADSEFEIKIVTTTTTTIKIKS